MTIPLPGNENDAGSGGADLFLDFIAERVKPAVRERFPNIRVDREALYGHSYGALFALHGLFTRPAIERGGFDAYLASSPSIWWGGRCVLEEARNYTHRAKEARNPTNKVPALLMYVGGLEQEPRRWRDETDESWEKRTRDAKIFDMRRNALELVEVVKDAPLQVGLREYAGEDHGTVMACSLSRGLATFFEDWPLREEDLD